MQYKLSLLIHVQYTTLHKVCKLHEVFHKQLNRQSVRNLLCERSPRFTTVPPMFVNTRTDFTDVREGSLAACKIPSKYLTTCT